MTTKTDTEQERAELLPCPFCGGTNIEIQISTPDREGVPTNLMCSDCGASGPWEYEQGNSHAKADAAWNTRAALQSQDREDAERFRFCLKHGFPQKWEEMIRGSLRYYWTSRPGSQEEFSSAIEAIDHARRAEEDGE